jgi:hypothetical protein
MRTRHVLLTTFLICAISFFFPWSGYAGWVLYDDFNSGVIDPSKWAITNKPNVATVSVENGAAKFVFNTNYPNTSFFMNMIQDTGKIMGIRAKVKIDTQMVGVRARFAANVAQDQAGNPLFNQINIRSYYFTNGQISQKVWYDLTALDKVDLVTSAYDIIYGEFYSPLGGTYAAPIDFTGHWVTMEMQFNQNKFSYGLPDLQYYINNIKPPDTLLKLTDQSLIFRGIGVRGTNEAPTGQTCIIYFDDVYVLK